MTGEETVGFLECRRAYYASLSTDPSSYVKATKVCGYTLAESANACLMAIEALKQKPVLDKIRAEIEQEPYVSKMEVLEIIDKYKVESEVNYDSD